MARGHAEALFPMIEDVLAEGHVAWTDISRIGVCTGPGSFTGIRAGVAAARGLALGLGVPAVGITRLEAVGPAPVAIRLRGDTIAILDNSGEIRLKKESDLPEDMAVREGEAALADVVAIARLARDRPAEARPAPAYLRQADAAPSSDMPPALLD